MYRIQKVSQYDKDFVAFCDLLFNNSKKFKGGEQREDGK